MSDKLYEPTPTAVKFRNAPIATVHPYVKSRDRMGDFPYPIFMSIAPGHYPQEETWAQYNRRWDVRRHRIKWFFTGGMKNRFYRWRYKIQQEFTRV